jgi:hypothetical protein
MQHFGPDCQQILLAGRRLRLDPQPPTPKEKRYTVHLLPRQADPQQGELSLQQAGAASQHGNACLQPVRLAGDSACRVLQPANPDTQHGEPSLPQIKEGLLQPKLDLQQGRACRRLGSLSCRKDPSIRNASQAARRRPQQFRRDAPVRWHEPAGCTQSGRLMVPATTSLLCIDGRFSGGSPSIGRKRKGRAAHAEPAPTQ